jgi:tetrapyrrole methylase family protein/MazG family protein
MKNDFNKLIDVVAIIRGPNGCPWDKKQNLYSLTDDFLEEAYEFVEAIKNDDIPNICEELGDVLLHVVIHTQMASESGLFTMDDVTDGIVSKIIRRHPHVFGDLNISDPDAVLVKWEEIKKEEKLKAGIAEADSILRKAKKPAPVLTKAVKLQAAAAKVGFDWPTHEAVLGKADEELAELKDAATSGDKAAITEELGDLLFIMANLARHFDIDPNEALEQANKKFVRRFGYVEQKLAEAGKTPDESNLEEMDSFWNEIRRADHDA